jgi:hypothetical protein
MRTGCRHNLFVLRKEDGGSAGAGNCSDRRLASGLPLRGTLPFGAQESWLDLTAYSDRSSSDRASWRDHCRESKEPGHGTRQQDLVRERIDDRHYTALPADQPYRARSG